MNYGQCCRIKSLSLLVMVFITMISAKPGGYVVKLGAQWKLSKVSVHDLSTGKDHLIDDGKCYGPVFSPDGKKVAYAKGNDIYIKNSDGTGEAKAQGVSVKTEGGGGTEPCMSWLNLNGEQYLYWSEGVKNSELYRTKLDSQKKETVWKGPSGLICVSMSADGKRGACTVKGYSAFQFDIETNKTHKYGGCQGSISPNGKYVTHNTSGSHKNTAIHDFDNTKTLKTINTPTGTINWQRFSHHTDDFFCATVSKKTAYICEWQTGTYTEAGPGAPLDYYPNEIPGFGQLDQAVGAINVVKRSDLKNVLHVTTQNLVSVSSSQPYRISISNLSGKVLYQYRNNTPHTLKLEQTGIIEGVHVIRLETENRIINKSVSYVKAR